eukprot:scaffold1863_cov381-Prasinococcus_capsulatus_cf.AAC.9
MDRVELDPAAAAAWPSSSARRWTRAARWLHPRSLTGELQVRPLPRVRRRVTLLLAATFRGGGAWSVLGTASAVYGLASDAARTHSQRCCWVGAHKARLSACLRSSKRRFGL